MSPTRERRLRARASCDCLIVFIEKKLAGKPQRPGEPSMKESKLRHDGPTVTMKRDNRRP
jgi:hypothetical protein